MGWLLLAGVLAVRVVAYERNLQWTESATILPAIACLTWTFGGWSLLRQAWPAIAFLVFMLPLPQPVNNLVSLPLQRIATTGSCFLLQLSGLWSIQEGNLIHLKTPHGMERLDVALACSGLRMLMMLAATVAATIILIPLPTWKRIILLLSAVPIALVTNMIRIVATGWCYRLGWNRQAAHDWSGYLMMPIGLLLVWLELSVLSWLVPKESPEDQKPILPTLMPQKSSKKTGPAVPEV
jgi:exosortase